MKTKSMYFKNIPCLRLKDILKKGDIITGHETKIGISANYTEFRITHVDKWGVYARPTDNMLKGMSKGWTKEFVEKCKKGHIKFKWCHIYTVTFTEEENI